MEVVTYTVVGLDSEHMPRESHRNWEYKTLRPPREATNKEARDPKAPLNELGAEGWELIDTIEYVGGGTKYLVFKRPIEQVDHA